MENVFNEITALTIKYKDDVFMTGRLESHLKRVIIMAEKELTDHLERQIRVEKMTVKKDVFVQVFLAKNQYFYLPNTNCYFFYDGINYSVVKVDDIHYKLLTTISQDVALMPWKHKTKFTILKQIKGRSLFRSIPNVETFQLVIQCLYPNVFQHKTSMKYFLTLIGDLLLRKPSRLTYLVKPKNKKYLNEIDKIFYLISGIPSVTQDIVTKYHESYELTDCRLISMDPKISVSFFKEFIQKNGINMAAIACYYSNRYGNSETFISQIEQFGDNSRHALLFKTKTKNDLLEEFCAGSLEVTTEPHKISWRNMHYLWKSFISKSAVPNIIYSGVLKFQLSQLYPYDKETDYFNHVTSKHLPTVSKFLEFWKDTMTVVLDIPDIHFARELEIEEISATFKCWANENGKHCKQAGLLTEGEVLKVMMHYFPDIKVVDHKYVYDVVCRLCDKRKDIDIVLQLLREDLLLQNDLVYISLEDMYTFYLKRKQLRISPSKKYFESYVSNKLSSLLIHDKLVSVHAWLLTT